MTNEARDLKGIYQDASNGCKPTEDASIGLDREYDIWLCRAGKDICYVGRSRIFDKDICYIGYITNRTRIFEKNIGYIGRSRMFVIKGSQGNWL